MPELFPVLLPLLMIDVLNPVLFALLLVAIGSRQPLANSSALLAGHTLAYFGAGIVIAIALERITGRLANPKPVDFLIELALGLLCLWAALAARGGKASEPRNPDGELTPLGCLGYGAAVNFIGVPFALPYFAAIDQLLNANLSTEASLGILLAYNLAYVLPFALVPVSVALVGDRSQALLQKINSVMVSLADRLMPAILFLLGLALSADALAFLWRGEALW